MTYNKEGTRLSGSGVSCEPAEPLISFWVDEPDEEELLHLGLTDTVSRLSNASSPTTSNVSPKKRSYAISTSNRFCFLKDYGATSLINEEQISTVCGASLTFVGGGKVQDDDLNVVIAKKIAEYFRKNDISQFTKRHQSHS